ncbi:MAG: hypothetical protein OEL87_01540 [Nanoarchaeota archaeon]|nr:hypothetical protein [Nanoarchaeota archaeon]
MEERYANEIIGSRVVVWTIAGLKYVGETTWIDSISIWLKDTIAKCERIIPLTAISSIELREAYRE